MPIAGLSTREAVKPSFRILGKLRKGGPKQKNQPGVDLTYFRFTSDDPAIVVAFTAAYGDKPDALDIFLPHETMEDCFSSWREEYGQNRLCKLRCDGKNWIKWIDGLTVHTKRRECDRPYRDTENRCPDCPAGYVGRLEVIPRKLWEAGYIGVVTVETHAVNDIGTIAGKLVQHEPLRGIEFKLSRVERRVSAPNKKTGKRIAVTKSLLSLEPTRDWILEELDAAAYQRIAELNGEPPAALPAMTEAAVEEAEFATAVVEEGKAEVVKETETPGENGGEDEFDKENPDLADWLDLCQKAIKYLGFNDAEEVRATYKIIFPHGKPALNDAWFLLRDHQQSKEDDKKPVQSEIPF